MEITRIISVKSTMLRPFKIRKLFLITVCVYKIRRMFFFRMWKRNMISYQAKPWEERYVMWTNESKWKYKVVEFLTLCQQATLLSIWAPFLQSAWQSKKKRLRGLKKAICHIWTSGQCLTVLMMGSPLNEVRKCPI